MSTPRAGSGWERREALERAGAAVVGSVDPVDELEQIQASFDALVEMAGIALELDGAQAPLGREPEGDQLSRRNYLVLTPMKRRVAWALIEHADRLKALRRIIESEGDELREGVGELARLLLGMGEGDAHDALELLYELGLEVKRDAA